MFFSSCDSLVGDFLEFNQANRGYNNSIFISVTAAAKSLQLYLTLSNPIEGSPPGSSVPGILQARILDGLPFHSLL